jgi:hypothetical protein
MRRLQEQPPYFMCPQHWRPHDASLGIVHRTLPPHLLWDAPEQGRLSSMDDLQTEFEQALEWGTQGGCVGGWIEWSTQGGYAHGPVWQSLVAGCMGTSDHQH